MSFHDLSVHAKDKNSHIKILNRLLAVILYQFLEMMNINIIIIDSSLKDHLIWSHFKVT